MSKILCHYKALVEFEVQVTENEEGFSNYETIQNSMAYFENDLTELIMDELPENVVINVQTLECSAERIKECTP